MFDRRPNSQERIGFLGFNANRIWLVGRFIYFLLPAIGSNQAGIVDMESIWSMLILVAHLQRAISLLAACTLSLSLSECRFVAYHFLLAALLFATCCLSR